MTKHRRGSYTASELAKQTGCAEARLLFAALGECFADMQSAAVFFAGAGSLAVELAGAWPSLHVSGFELRESAVTAARVCAREAGLGDRAVFARVDPRIGAFGPHDLIVVRYPVSEVADGEGALRAAAQASSLIAVFERSGLAHAIARSAQRLGLETRASVRDAHAGPVLQVFEAR